MDLSLLLRSSDAQLRLDLVSPPLPRLADAPLLAPPGPLHPTLATSAFSYLLRFELERRHPHARRHAWLAEGAAERLRTLAPDLAASAEAMVASAHRDLAAYVEEREPGAPARELAAMHALRLGRLDAVVRAGYVDRALGADETADGVAELLAMLEVAPWAEIGGAQSLDLGPSFAGDAPEARADVVADGLLLVVRTTRTARIERDDLRGLLFRLILARAQRALDGAAHEVREVGVAFARHGRVWRTPVDALAQHPHFAGVEAWFAERLEQAQRAQARAQGEGASGPAAPRPPRWVKKKATAAKGAPARREGKAEVKKAGGPKPAEAPRGGAGKPAPPRRKAPPAPQEPDGDAPKRAKPPKPDWRKGSAWRRDRGL